VSKQKKNLTEDRGVAHFPQVIRQSKTRAIQMLCYVVTLDKRLTKRQKGQPEGQPNCVLIVSEIRR
jgi:hypothetical protein